MEKAKQDDGLADLSDLLSELKNMAIDMGTEIERFSFISLNSLYIYIHFLYEYSSMKLIYIYDKPTDKTMDLIIFKTM